MSREKISGGIHSIAQQHIEEEFSEKEARIAQRWAELWFITKAGKKAVASSEYKFFYAKPTEIMEESTGITKELVVIFSQYDKFDARSLSAYDAIVESDIEQRYEKLCYVLISKDPNAEEEITSFVSGQEKQIVVPFSYDSFTKCRTDQFYIRNQLWKYFFSRDLFDYSEPLKRDFFFFGRTDVVTQIIDKHKAGQNMGAFGLRKTGKTSIIYDVIRKSKSQDFIAVNIDCQNPDFNNRRWYEALYYVAQAVLKEYKTCHIEINENDFTEKTAAGYFEKYIRTVHAAAGKTILIMFDEIENISYRKSPAAHWCDGLDFVFFWQSVRSAYQMFSDAFTFCIFGTNPQCVEIPTIEGKDNPIFNVVQPTYISGFSVDQTREMVRKLGRVMGIRFDETIYSKLVEDYGGHPFLIRRVCSKLAKLYSGRPVDIDRIKYTKAKEAFNIENTYFDMILAVLTQFYPDEYEMLRFLAINDKQNFYYFVNLDPAMVSHLIGYGIIAKSGEDYDFKIDAIKEYIIRLNNDHIKPTTASEKWKSLCEQRNHIEVRLRRVVRNVVRTSCKNEAEAKEFIVKKVFASDKKLYAHRYNDLFDPKKVNIYLKNLGDIIIARWDYFTDYFGKQEIFINYMNILNNEGRFDAHSKEPEDSEIGAVDNAVRYMDDAIKKYEEAMS